MRERSRFNTLDLSPHRDQAGEQCCSHDSKVHRRHQEFRLYPVALKLTESVPAVPVVPDIRVGELVPIVPTVPTVQIVETPGVGSSRSSGSKRFNGRDILHLACGSHLL